MRRMTYDDGTVKAALSERGDNPPRRHASCLWLNDEVRANDSPAHLTLPYLWKAYS